MADIAACRYHCPNCDAEIEQEGYVLVEAQDTEQVQALLEGELNIITCPNCDKQSRLPLPLLYHDLENQLLICYVPDAAHLSPDQINASIEYPYSNLISRVADRLGVELPLPDPNTLPRNELGEVVPYATMTAEEAAKILPAYLLRPTIVDGIEVVQAVVQAVEEGLSTQSILDDMARLQLINGLLNAPDPITKRKIIHHSEPLLNDELYEVIDTLSEQMVSDSNQEMADKLGKVKLDIESYKRAQQERLAKSKAKKADA